MLGVYSYKSRVEGICSAFNPVHGQKGVEQFIFAKFLSVQKMVCNHYYSYWIKMLVMTKGLGTPKSLCLSF